MKNVSIVIILVFVASISLQAQKLDTLIDVGGYNLHYNIIKGKGIPILFESGGGQDGSIWNNILDPIYNVTGTTLITYDRSGFGKSEINLKETNVSKHGIINGLQELETGLNKLGYDDNIILVSHSYGGFYSTLYAARHPEKVKYVVMVDANTVDVFTDDYIKNNVTKYVEMYKENLGMYYTLTNLSETVQIMRQTEFPNSIPVIDLISDIPGIQFQDEELWRRWKDTHKKFDMSQPNRLGITAYGCEHSIYDDNPALVIHSIIKAYSEVVSKEQSCDILIHSLDNAIDLSNEAKKKEIEFIHSEADLNQWGYSLIQENELEKALEVFKLNVFLFPESWNVYDSFGEALLNANRKEEATQMYEKSIKLNPNNEKTMQILEKIKKN